jgi:hypothetical protein
MQYFSKSIVKSIEFRISQSNIALQVAESHISLEKHEF